MPGRPIGARISSAQSSQIRTQENAASAKHVWTWYCRMDRGIDVIDKHMAGLSAKARARFERSRDQLKAMPLSMWSKPHPASYVQKNHIYVIRFKDEASTQWRVFGHAIPDSYRFVMTIIGTEKDDVYIPSDAGNRADKFRTLVESDFSKYACKCYPEPLKDGERASTDLCVHQRKNST